MIFSIGNSWVNPIGSVTYLHSKKLQSSSTFLQSKSPDMMSLDEL
jgi:hypothetical protein